VITLRVGTKTGLNSDGVFCHSVQNLLSPSLLSEDAKIKMRKTVIYLLFCVGVKLVLLRKRRLRLFEELTGSLRMLDAGLHNLHSSPNIVTGSN
jgi:hypothetical protein